MNSIIRLCALKHCKHLELWQKFLPYVKSLGLVVTSAFSDLLKM